MDIKINDKNGVVLRTKDKYLTEDINISIDKRLIGSGEETLKKLLDFTKSTANMFYKNTTITDLTCYISYSDTSNVTDMSSMFKECITLPTIPQLDTSNVTNMSQMFYSCNLLTAVPPLDTSNVTNMSQMFYNCDYLTTIPQLDTSNVTDMSLMFCECISLTTIPLLDTSNVTTMKSMFSWCSDLKEVSLLDTSNVTDMSGMFSNCNSLTTIPQLDTSSVTNMSNMFKSCSKLTTIPPLDTSNVTNMESMFLSCSKLTTIDISHYNISSTSNSGSWCQACCSLKAIIIRSFGTTYALGSSAFYNCYHLTGTVNSTYNPNGDKDCYIYVPRDMCDTLKFAANWSTYADNICAIYNVSKLGNGNITENINSNGETIINAQEENSNFTGWYKGILIEKYILIDQKESSYETLNVTYPFTLNDNGYYQNSNQKVSSSFSIGRFKFNIESENQQLRITYLQSSESGYDYGVIGNVDTELPQDTTTTGYKKLKSITATTPQEILIDGINVGEHFIDIKYIKDGSGDNGNDTLQVKVEVVTMGTRDELMNQELYSTEKEVNLGVIDEQTMEPLNLVAVFEDIN